MSLDGLSEQDLLIMEKLIQLRDIRIHFALEHHRNTSGERMDFDHYPHILPIYNSLARKIVLQGAVQSLKSEWAIIDHFSAAYSGLSVFFVVPKYETRTTYVQNRVNRCVQNVPEYKKIIGEGFFDSVAIKSFGRGVIKYVGSNVLSDFKEFPADMIIVDEVDQCNFSNLQYGVDRLRASKYQFERYLGNPTHSNRGINHYFLISDQREWFVPCFSCGKYQESDWFGCVVEEVSDREGNVIDYKLRDREWRIGCGRDIYMICKCGGILDRNSRNGRWVPKNPDSSIEGYHISMLCSLINSISDMWVLFRTALDDPTRMQQFYNSILGLPYNPIGNKVSSQLLDRCVEPGYKFVLKSNCAHIPSDRHSGPCSMGVDVGGVFDVKVSYVDSRGRRKMVYVGKVRNVEELHDIIERYNVEKAVFDSMPETLLVKEFQEISPADVWLCRYRGEGTDGNRIYDISNKIIGIDRTELLDRAFADIKKGRVILPENYRHIFDGEYISEMCLPVREVITNDKGEQRFEWSKGKDHQRHADGYDLLAAELMTTSVISDVLIG